MFPNHFEQTLFVVIILLNIIDKGGPRRFRKRQKARKNPKNYMNPTYNILTSNMNIGC